MRVRWVLACLMADMLDPGAGDRLPEPWKGLVARLAALPIESRLEALGNELGSIPGVDVDAVLDVVFAIDPRNPAPESPPTSSFPFSPLYTGKRETQTPSTPVSPSTPLEYATRTSFQGGRNAEMKCQGLQTVALGAFLEIEDPDLAWCVERIFPLGGVSILAAPGGWGKSWMLLDLAVEVARGGRWLGRFQSTQATVLYLDEESSPRLLRHRLRKLLKGKSLRAADLDIHFAVGQGFSLSNPESVAQLKRLLEDLKPGLVIIDSLIRVHTAEENSASEMSKVFAVVKDLVRQSGATIVFADHQRKQGHIAGNLDQLLRGSSEKKAFADCLLSMQRKDGALIVEQSKSRFDQEIPSFVVLIEDPEPGATTVRCLGDAEGIKNAAMHEQAEEFLHSAIPLGEWVTRKDLAAQAKAEGIPQRLLADTLKELVAGGQLDRDDRKTDDGAGRKQAHYRWKREATSFHGANPPETMSGEGNQLPIKDLDEP